MIWACDYAIVTLIVTYVFTLSALALVSVPQKEALVFYAFVFDNTHFLAAIAMTIAIAEALVRLIAATILCYKESGDAKMEAIVASYYEKRVKDLEDEKALRHRWFDANMELHDSMKKLLDQQLERMKSCKDCKPESCSDTQETKEGNSSPVSASDSMRSNAATRV